MRGILRDEKIGDGTHLTPTFLENLAWKVESGLSLQRSRADETF